MEKLSVYFISLKPLLSYTPRHFALMTKTVMMTIIRSIVLVLASVI